MSITLIVVIQNFRLRGCSKNQIQVWRLWYYRLEMILGVHNVTLVTNHSLNVHHCTMSAMVIVNYTPNTT